MKYKYLLLILLVLASCGSEKPDEILTEGFKGGFEGLVPRALESAPPSVVSDGGSFPFSVIIPIENVGESNVGPGTENPFVLARLSRIRPQDFNLEVEDMATRVTERIDPARKNFDNTILPGGVVTAEWEALMFMPRLTSSELFTPTVELCYDYSTHVTTKVCIKDDIIENIQDNTICNLRSQLYPLNSGAPVQVVDAVQNPVGDESIQVNFVVQNVGNGVPFNRRDDTDFGACELDLSNRNIYKVLVVVHPVDENNYGLECKGMDNTKSGFEDVAVSDNAEFHVINLRNNAPKSLSCFLTKDGDISGRIFQDLLNIDLYYRYGAYLELPMLIQEARGMTELVPSTSRGRDSDNNDE